MDFQLIVGLLLTMLPITELRVGLPVIIQYCFKNNLPIFPFFILVIVSNILVIFLIYLFLEKLHKVFLRWELYSRLFHKFIDRLRKKQDKFEKKFNEVGYLALAIFVAVPLPGTGAWTGTFLAWLIGLEKKKSIVAISFGVIIAGLIVLFSVLGFMSVFYS